MGIKELREQFNAYVNEALQESYDNMVQQQGQKKTGRVNEFSTYNTKNKNSPNRVDEKKKPYNAKSRQTRLEQESNNNPQADRTMQPSQGSITHKTTHIEGKEAKRENKSEMAAYSSKKAEGSTKKDISQSAGVGAGKITNDDNNKIYSDKVKTNAMAAYLGDMTFQRKDIIKGIIYSEILAPKF